MDRAEFTVKEVENVIDAVDSMFKALTRKNREEHLGALNDTMLLLEALKRHAALRETAVSLALETASSLTPAELAQTCWAAEQAEWMAIRDELIEAAAGNPVSAWQVSLEQRKRMLKRGESPMTYDQIVIELGGGKL